MNQGPLVFVGTFFALAATWFTFVLEPSQQIGNQSQFLIEDSGQLFPAKPAGLAHQGEAVYRANGCFYCHTMQVRPQGLGGDAARGWGARSGPVQSVSRDYLFAETTMLGSQRVGPYLTNIGLRQTNLVWHLQHLYDPSSLAPGSTMPPYRFLFTKHTLKPGQKRSPDALPEDPKAPGVEVLPSDDAKALVAYLTGLHSDGVLYEAPAFYVKPVAKADKKAAVPVTPAPAPAK